ncbi:peritrophin-44-like [Hydractinia symbiolongicarpus]|uniref:peritrophin-44-like n=1 Tax=Hydractinia symbiolongicarpus TaxID=13093 RepID=UPI002550314D|nr:peritrophin-44-like [Hydractinia symbiolongicarpus]
MLFLFVGIATVLILGTKSSRLEGSRDAICNEKPDGYYKDPKNCKGYVTCKNGMTYHQECPFELFYNADKKLCDFEENVDCPIIAEKTKKDICTMEERSYNRGENFVIKDCSGKCKCEGPNYKCTPLCPPFVRECELSGKFRVEQYLMSQDPICYCERKICENIYKMV